MAGRRLPGIVSLAVLTVILIVLCGYPLPYNPLFPYAGGFVLILIALNFLSLRPLVIRPREKGSQGKFISGRENSDALLLVSGESPGRDFRGNDWGFAWMNTLEQELGGFLARRMQGFCGGDLKGKRLVVISGNAGGMPSEKIQAIGEFIGKGGIAILERPGAGFSDISGVRGLGKTVAAGRITWIDGKALAEPYNSLLREMPLNTTIAGAGLDRGCRTLMEIDKKPAICLKKYGKGLVVSLLFDYGLQMVSLQQGVPSGPGYRVEAKSGKIGKTLDLVMDGSLVENFFPCADVLEKLIFHIVEDVMPLKRPWYFPYPYDGALVMSHDEEYMGNGASFVTDYERGIKATSSFFPIPDSPISGETLKGMGGIDIGIHWNRQPGIKPVFGIGFIKLVKRVMPLWEQLCLLKWRGVDAKTCRIHLSEWGEDYTGTFRVMEACGILMDSSYMPGRGKGKGYMFGTGFPFRPLDRNGMPFGLYELPVLIQDNYGGAGLGDVEKLLRESAESYHQYVVLLYHPNRIEKSRELEGDWKGAFGAGGRNWVTNLSEIRKWLEERGRGSCSYFVLKRGGLKAGGESRRVRQLGREYLLVKGV